MNILVYDDNPDFGGHQIMAARGIEALVETPGLHISLMCNPKNRKLIRILEHLKHLTILEADATRIQTLEPDRVLVIQGDIAQSTAGLCAARDADIECLSYIAIPHRLAEMGAKMGKLRDIKNRPLFRKPDRFITISESMAERLRERGACQPVTIVQNGIPAPPIPRLTIHDTKFTIGIIGRIEFSQKQQDFFVRTFRRHPSLFSDCRVLFIGSGPDEENLKKLIKGDHTFAHLPWQKSMEETYEVLDMLVIPSRYEGVPLVMLEALARGIPVIGSRRDGMQDILPSDWTFTPEDAASLATTFSSARQNWQHKIADLQNRILEEHSLEHFNTNFVNAVTQK
ncbi:glycosyltransferase family 4 protein [Pontiella agarivorans]|uniref:Glycosyltransferase family 4 protein n=1 Tax=Pontiella agarivorans TaxID=3038953 RepID=A0ABU5N029_9BACT|nr:glycosyltransferase family 4 protein [Pontiella agarivorans]MDZ8119814.1 glycosyltransferase family 4 protein [Pontiella agarivorans]